MSKYKLDPKRKIEDFEYEQIVVLNNIANELAERNRLKRVELRTKIIELDLNEEYLEDKA